MAPSLWPLAWYLSFHLAPCSTGAHAHRSALLSPGSGFNKWNDENRRGNHRPSRVSTSERIHWQGDGILSLPTSFSIAHQKLCHFPLSPTPSWPPQTSLSSALESSPWPHEFWLGHSPLWHYQGPSPGWSSVSRCQGRPWHQGPISLGSPCGPSNGSCASSWVLPVSMP